MVTQERPDLANLKSQLVVSNAKMKKELSDIEDRILQLLSASSGNILDDEELINTLAQSKVRHAPCPPLPPATCCFRPGTGTAATSIGTHAVQQTQLTPRSCHLLLGGSS